jgi:signal transduction histidine kinase
MALRCVARLLLAVVIVWPATGHADMLCQTPGVDGPYEAQIARDPQGAIRALRALLASRPDGPAPSFTKAHLYAMLADADWVANDLAAGRDAITRGQAALVPEDGEALRRRLVLAGQMIQASEGDPVGALGGFETATATLPDSAPDLACILIDRGFLRQFVGHFREAYADLTRAYRIAGDQGSKASRMMAAALLSNLYRTNGFPEEARLFADEVIAQAEKLQDSNWLAEGYFRRGDVLQLVEDYAGAEASFARARDHWKEQGSAEGVMASEQRLCATLVKLPDRARARATCAQACQAARNGGVFYLEKAILGSQGELELLDGHPAAALSYLDRALASDHGGLNKTRQAEFTRLRGEARARLGDYAGAFRDQSTYLDWVQHSNLLVHDISQIAVTRTRYEAAIQEQRLLRARDGAKMAAQEASRQLVERSLLMVAFLLFLGMAVFLTWAQRRRQDSLREARVAEERMSTMSRVVGGIAHDFNNQLTVMMQAIGLLASHPAVGGEAALQELVQAIRQSCAACAQVTAQMLSFSRQQHLQPEPVPLGGFLDGLRPGLERLAGDGVHMKYEVDSPEPVAFVDARQLEAALLNLIGNARDAMSGRGDIVVRAGSGAGDTVQLAVIDPGVGMSPEVLARATEPFYSTKPVGGGSGLGLSMVQGFATQSGGSLRVSSEPGRGTTVCLELPAASAPASRNQPSIGAPRSS